MDTDIATSVTTTTTTISTSTTAAAAATSTNTNTNSPTTTTTNNTTETTATTASRHYFYRKATQPDLNNSTVFLNVAESNDDFESRVTNFIQKDMLQQTLSRLRQDAATDLTRRKADRKARKEKERNSNNVEGTAIVAEPRVEKSHRHQEERTGPLFEKLSTLNPTEQNQWLANIHDDAMLMNPHQWLKLANLFNVNSKASRQKTLLKIRAHSDVLKDRNMDQDDHSVPLENYMELRDVQNRNYARDAVAEGVKYIKQNRIKEAMDYYKRALDMDPKYADGWFHVAEGLVQQRKLQEAAIQLERALKLEPEHEGAKALLASIRYTTQTKKPEKGDEWDLVDETGHGLSSAVEKAASSSSTTKVDNEDKDKSSSKKKKKSSSSSNHRRSSHHRSSRRSRSPVSRDSRNRSRESRHRRDYDDKHRESRRSSPDNSRSRRHRRSNRSRSRDSERTSRRDNDNNENDGDKRRSRHRSRRDDSSPRESRSHRSRRSSRERESRHSNSKSEKSRYRSRSRSPSKQSKRKRSDDDNDDTSSHKSQKEKE